MPELEIFLWKTQAPNTSLQISKNIGATKKASTKMVHDKVFFKHFGKKAIFYPKIVAPQKQVISYKSVHWYQCNMIIGCFPRSECMKYRDKYLQL